jgi:hypothetical protein
VSSRVGAAPAEDRGEFVLERLDRERAERGTNDDVRARVDGRSGVVVVRTERDDRSRRTRLAQPIRPLETLVASRTGTVDQEAVEAFGRELLERDVDRRSNEWPARSRAAIASRPPTTSVYFLSDGLLVPSRRADIVSYRSFLLL